MSLRADALPPSREYIAAALRADYHLDGALFAYAEHLRPEDLAASLSLARSVVRALVLEAGRLGVRIEDRNRRPATSGPGVLPVSNQLQPEAKEGGGLLGSGKRRFPGNPEQPSRGAVGEAGLLNEAVLRPARITQAARQLNRDGGVIQGHAQRLTNPDRTTINPDRT